MASTGAESPIGGNWIYYDVNPDEAAEPSDTEDIGWGLDDESHLAHDPLNNGGNNQMASGGTGKYQTRKLGGRKVTLDRAGAQANIGPQMGRTWLCNRDGVWVQYSKAGQIDWTDKKSVERLNKWRRQTASRHGWPLVRDGTRPNYGEAEREWVVGGPRPQARDIGMGTNRTAQLGTIVAAGGQKPSFGATADRALATGFGRVFPVNPPRKASGVNSLVMRTLGEYRDAGALRPRQPKVPSGTTRSRPRGRKAKAEEDEEEEEEEDEEEGEEEEEQEEED